MISSASLLIHFWSETWLCVLFSYLTLLCIIAMFPKPNGVDFSKKLGRSFSSMLIKHTYKNQVQNIYICKGCIMFCYPFLFFFVPEWNAPHSAAENTVRAPQTEATMNNTPCNMPNGSTLPLGWKGTIGFTEALGVECEKFSRILFCINPKE